MTETQTAAKRVAVVTGSASGLGAAIARTLESNGWVVAGLDLRPSATTSSTIVDVTDATAVAETFAAVEESLGAIDALVTVAGIYEMLPVVEITDDRWDRMLSVNIQGTVNAIAAVVPSMSARGAGNIVTISSDLGFGGSQGDPHYAATKGAIVGLSRSLAIELADSGVVVNSVAPGAADTPMLASDSPWRDPAFLDSLPVKRLVVPEEIAAAVVFFLDAGTDFAGQILSPNSGATI